MHFYFRFGANVDSTGVFGNVINRCIIIFSSLATRTAIGLTVGISTIYVAIKINYDTIYNYLDSSYLGQFVIGLSFFRDAS